MKTLTTEAVVLKHSLFKDNDKIITLLTKDLGKVSAIAKGIRKFNSKRSGQLDILTHIKISLVDYGGRYIVTEVKSLNSFPKIKNNFDLSKKAFYLLELVHRFLEEDDTKSEIYSLLLSAILKLESYEKFSGFIVKHFELKLLASLGYEMCLDRCAKCGKKYVGDWKQVSFNFDYGGLICDECNVGGFKIQIDTANLLSYLYSPSEFSERPKNLVRESDYVVTEFMERVLGKPVKSLRVFSV